MADQRSKLETVDRFFSGTGSSYDRVVVVGTCGFDKYWKRRLVQAIPARPTHIVDQACGTGILTFEIARRFPACRVTGVELRDEYLGYARDKARSLALTNVDFVLGRAEDVVVDDGCDCITSSYLAKYADLDPLIANAKRMLRPGGVIAMHDFTYPSRPLFRALWPLYFHTLSLIGKRIFPEWSTVFDELPEFLRQTRWVAECSALLKHQAFTDVEVAPLTFGSATLVTARAPERSPR